MTLATASITLETATAGRVGANRIALLAAIDEAGSLSAAAKRVGLSYKSAWDAVQVLNNLFDRPLVLAATGGRDGGGSVVTEAGHAVIAAFRAAELELASTISRLEIALSVPQAGALKSIFWGMAMKTSARNVLRGTVSRIVTDSISAEVTLEIAEGVEVVATITTASAAALGLAEGAPALALIKSSFVILASGEPALRTSARNALIGTVTARTDTEVSSEITLELQLGKTLTATVTRESADTLDLVLGSRATALIKSSHIILAVE